MDERIPDIQAIIRHMVATSGMSYAEVSRAMGRNDRYVAGMLKEETTPRLDLFIRIAETCGYVLELCEAQDYESWELSSESGKVCALKEHGPEDIEQLSQMDKEMRDHFRGEGRKELIDSLIEYLEGLKEQHSD